MTIDWHLPTAQETAPIREALEANRKHRNAIDRQRILERVRAELDQGPMTAEEYGAFRTSVARAYAEAERRRQPHPQAEIPL